MQVVTCDVLVSQHGLYIYWSAHHFAHHFAHYLVTCEVVVSQHDHYFDHLSFFSYHLQSAPSHGYTHCVEYSLVHRKSQMGNYCSNKSKILLFFSQFSVAIAT